MIQDAIGAVVEGRGLSTQAAHAVMLEMMRGNATPSQIASFMTAMRMKGETEEELLGFVTAMRECSVPLAAPEGSVDLCGTGGDGSNTFNISTAASVVAASTGLPVAKHGNRSVSSRSGSADVLSALGVPIDLPPQQVEQCLATSGLGFMFAPLFHGSMRNVSAPRKELGLRTFFNILGPMTNPASVKHQLIGVYDPKLAPMMASVLSKLGTKRAMIVHGSGMDEITNAGVTQVVELFDGGRRSYSLEPGMFGLDAAEPSDLRGGDALENARIILAILKGERSVRSDIVALNAAAAVYVSGRVASMQDGLEVAQEAIRSRRAYAALRRFAEVSRALETERQKGMEARGLVSRRIMPEVLLERAPDIARELHRQVHEMGGEHILESLDSQLLVEPNILSVLVLNRARSLLNSSGSHDSDALPRARSTLSQSIASRDGLAVIAEYKPGSPGAPGLSVPPEPVATARSFTGSGVAGVSVLVEPDFFSGGTSLFACFRSAISEPMVFKDFVVDERQLDTAARIGADAILLIAKALTDESMDRLVKGAVGRGMEPLVEVHDETDMSKLCACPSLDLVKLVGLNSRDLGTLKTDLSSVGSLRDMVPEGKLCIAESGIQRASDIAMLEGFDAVLVGSMLMKADDLEQELGALVRAGVRS